MTLTALVAFSAAVEPRDTQLSHMSTIEEG